MKALIAAYARSPQQFRAQGRIRCNFAPTPSPRRSSPDCSSARGSTRRCIEDVILGCAYPEGPQGSNLARIVALLGGSAAGSRRHDGQPILRLVDVRHSNRRGADRGRHRRGLSVRRRGVDEHGAAGRLQ